MYVPVGVAEAYKNDTWWSWFQNIIETPELDGGQSIGINAAVIWCEGNGKTAAIYTLDGRYLGTNVNKLPPRDICRELEESGEIITRHL